MASKWMKGKEELFNKFREEKKQEAEREPAGPRRADIVWKTPEKGTVDKAKTYIFRLLVDKNGNFYKSFFYHMFQNSKGKWTFVLCPKTHNFENYCPLCTATMELYRGNKEDKKSGYNYKRKRKHCSNVYIIKDPRDADAEDENEKTTGKVLIYEFPDKVESKINAEMNDDEYGNGMNIFDPGEDGVDFILKVASTKPIQEEGPNKGKQFPDYSDSKFSNKSYALGKDDEIKAILDSTHDLDAYLKSMERTDDELIEMVKEEMLWDMISKNHPNNNKSNVRQDIKSTEEMDSFPGQETTDQSEDEKQEDYNDDDLLKELEEFDDDVAF